MRLKGVGARARGRFCGRIVVGALACGLWTSASTILVDGGEIAGWGKRGHTVKHRRLGSDGCTGTRVEGSTASVKQQTTGCLLLRGDEWR
jgi:hypothetical protein